jgi:uncharacterized protein (DUF58 family)
MASLRGKWAQQLTRLARPRMPESLPVELHRRRIYVLPTAFGGFIILLLATMLLGALNYNNNPALLLGLLLGAIAIASTIIAHLQLAGLRVEAIDAEPIQAGTPLQVRLALSCTDQRRRSGLRLDIEHSTAFCSLQPCGSAFPELRLASKRRGWRQLDRIRISTTQPLGLVRAWSWVWPTTPLLVYPKAEAAGPPLPTDTVVATQSRLQAQGEDLQQLRPYHTGDARHAIAWKHSARRATLLVREYEQPIGGEIVLDWHRLTALPHEARIARLAHWVGQAEREARRYQLRLPGHPPLGPARGPQHQHQCLRALALLPYA